MDDGRTLSPKPAITCPCCGGWSLELFEDTFDADGNIVGVQICLVCSALVNRSSLEALARDPESLRDAQLSELQRAYPDEANVAEALKREVIAFDDTLRFFLAQTGNQEKSGELVCAEIGVGRGTLLRAAAALFKRCYGIDLGYDLFDLAARHLNVPENIDLLDAIENVPEPLDVVFAWHSFEHIPHLHDMVATIRKALKPGGHIFFQVPLYRPAHLVPSHYAFLNRRAVSVLAELESLRLVEMWTDHPRACLTGLLEKPAT